MKRLLVPAFVFVAAILPAQTTYTVETDHYVVVSEYSEDHAEQLGVELEAFMVLFNDFFRFDATQLENRLNVRVFASENRYDRYLRRLIDDTRDDFIYLHYRDAERSELVGYLPSEDARDVSMTHQSFVQFLRAFVPNPPLWIREGFAVYFEEARYDEALERAVLIENLAWLETLKQIIAGQGVTDLIPLDQLLVLDVETARQAIDVFYPESWGIVSFLIHDENRGNNRILWDAISALEPEKDQDENAAAITERALRFVDVDQLVEDFLAYVDSRRTFRELVEDGIDAYGQARLDAAEELFVRARERRPDNYIPYYYLGLINYDRSDYSLADHFYTEALNHGADSALTYYALGVNAFADRRYDDAVSYLETSLELDPDSYSTKVGDLLRRIEG